MPLFTQIERDGETLTLNWCDFHVASMILAAAWDSGIGPFVENAPPEGFEEHPVGVTPKDCFNLVMYPVIAATPLNKGDYTLTKDFKFVDTTDGEELNLLRGDVLRAWRS